MTNCLTIIRQIVIKTIINTLKTGNFVDVARPNSTYSQVAKWVAHAAITTKPRNGSASAPCRWPIRCLRWPSHGGTAGKHFNESLPHERWKRIASSIQSFAEHERGVIWPTLSNLKFVKFGDDAKPKWHDFWTPRCTSTGDLAAALQQYEWVPGTEHGPVGYGERRRKRLCPTSQPAAQLNQVTINRNQCRT